MEFHSTIQIHHLTILQGIDQSGWFSFFLPWEPGFQPGTGMCNGRDGKPADPGGAQG